MRLKPSFDRLVVKRDAAPQNELINGLLYKPDTIQPRPMTGTVLAVGEAATDVQVGDRVRFDYLSGYDVEVDGEELLIVRETEIIGILDGDDE